MRRRQASLPVEGVQPYPGQIVKVIDSIRAADYTVFVRKNLTVLSHKENIHDFFNVKILPDIHVRNVAERCKKLDNMSRKLAARGMKIPESLEKEIEFTKK